MSELNRVNDTYKSGSDVSMITDQCPTMESGTTLSIHYMLYVQWKGFRFLQT